ncbi:MAG: hypothetical protein O3A55_06545 [Bacteroidetes bacterium]|nr:hypothetical protein [Bacteroidota bacterium]
MKNLIFFLSTLFVIGCNFENPLDFIGEVPYSEESMFLTTQASDIEMQNPRMHPDGGMHDSLRHLRMLEKLKTYVGLTDVQYNQVKVFADKLFADLKDVRLQVRAKSISRDSARSLVLVARDLFIASTKAILTAEQNVKFDEWIKKYWNHRHMFGHRRGRPGHGGGGN